MTPMRPGNGAALPAPEAAGVDIEADLDKLFTVSYTTGDRGPR